MNGPVQFDSTSTAQTAGVGAAVAMVAVPGDVIALIGELGAGKRVFVGGMAHGLGLPPQTVSSPSSLAARMIRKAISPRLAMSTFTWKK